MITPTYAAVLGLFLAVLSLRVVRLRRRTGASLGAGDAPLLGRAIRVQGNFSEYVPMVLLLMLCLELLRPDERILLHAAGSVLLLGRALHAYGLSQVKEDFRFRVSGMACTMTVLIGLSLRILLIW